MGTNARFLGASFSWSCWSRAWLAAIFASRSRSLFDGSTRVHYVFDNASG
jgi:hypothetical protein